MEMQPHRFLTERLKISFIISHLSGRALQWAETICYQAGPATMSLQNFVTYFKVVFGRPVGDLSVSEQLYHLRQVTSSITYYSLRFRTLAAARGWNEKALLTTYRQGLNPALRLQLEIYDDTIGLEKCIQHSIHVARRVHNCYDEDPTLQFSFHHSQPDRSPTPEPEPMQVDKTRLSPTERTRRLTHNLCLYCGASSHYIGNCSIHPPRLLVSSVSNNSVTSAPLSTVVTLIAAEIVIAVTALIDRIHKTRTTTPYQVQSVTSRALNRGYVKFQIKPVTLRVGCLHEEQFIPLVLDGSTTAIILGRPWLIQHQPEISWLNGDVLRWGPTCYPTCFPKLPQPVPQHPMSVQVSVTSVESPRDKQSVDIQSCYAPYADVFCPKRTSRLPPDRPWDCAMNLEPGMPVPRGHIYSLSIPEQKAMEEYIEEALKQG